MAIELLLCLIREIDDHIAAENEIEARLELILQEIVSLELDHALDLLFDGIVVAVHDIKVLATTLGRHALDLIRRIDAALRLRQNLDIEIRGKDTVTRPGRHLLHNDGKRVRLCADGAASAPDIELRRAF